jgi:hypothetical protein
MRKNVIMPGPSLLRSLLLVIASIGGLVACPPTSEPPIPPDPITSIDGLEGGSITGNVSIAGNVTLTVENNLLTAPQIEAVGIFASDSINANAFNGGHIASGSLDVGRGTTLVDLTVNGAVTMATPPTMSLTQSTMTPVFVGSAQRPVSPSGQATRAVAQTACATAFEGSHICHEDELRLAVRSADVEPADLDGLTVESPHRVFAVAQVGDPVQLAQVVNDNCADWTIAPEVAGGGFVSTPAETIANGVTGLPKLHGRSEVSMTDGFAIKNVDGCAPSEVIFACCK